MTADPTTTLAAHAVDHVEYANKITTIVCTCGGRFNDPANAYQLSERISHPAHQLAVLAEEGWAIVKLPAGKSAEEAHRDIWDYFGEPGTYCGLGVCALGNGHHGACKC